MDKMDRSSPPLSAPLTDPSMSADRDTYSPRPNQVSSVVLYGVPIVSLMIDGIQRLCLAQISNTLLKDFSYNEIHNRRVALGITCVQCTPVQLEILRRAGAMPISSRRCGMITNREAERLCKSFLGDNAPPQLPDNFVFEVMHECAWGCRGAFVPSRYNSSRAKCIKCVYCSLFFSPNKFVFHSHRLADSKYVQPDAANFNSWRRHIKLYAEPPEEVIFAWEDVKAMFNGGTRKRLLTNNNSGNTSQKIPKQSHHSTPSIVKSSVTSPSLKSSELGHFSSYLGGITPLPPHYPNQNTQKGLDMRQSFMDYLWSSRSSVPPIGFPYSLPWPKRPLPSFPGLALTNNDGQIDSKDNNNSEIIKPDPSSAFTPVSTSGIFNEHSDKADQNRLDHTTDIADDKDKEKLKLLATRNPFINSFSIDSFKLEEAKEFSNEVHQNRDIDLTENNEKEDSPDPLFDQSHRSLSPHEAGNQENVVKADEDIDVTDEGKTDESDSQNVDVEKGSTPTPHSSSISSTSVPFLTSSSSFPPVSLHSPSLTPPTLTPFQSQHHPTFPLVVPDFVGGAPSAPSLPSLPTNLSSLASNFSSFSPTQTGMPNFNLSGSNLTEEDNRLRLLFFREFETRRRMELEMARVKLAHPSALHPGLHSSGTHHPVSSPFHHMPTPLGSMCSPLSSPLSSPPHHHSLTPHSPPGHHPLTAAALSSLHHHHTLNKDWFEGSAANL